VSSIFGLAIMKLSSVTPPDSLAVLVGVWALPNGLIGLADDVRPLGGRGDRVHDPRNGTTDPARGRAAHGLIGVVMDNQRGRAQASVAAHADLMDVIDMACLRAQGLLVAQADLAGLGDASAAGCPKP
jgi:hypothetical protein